MKRGQEGQRERRQKRLSVALIDSRSLIRDALAHRLRTIRRGCHVLLFSSAADLINDIAAYENVDLILVSARDEALAIVEQLSAASNSKRIIIISDSDKADCIAPARQQGARHAGGHGKITCPEPVKKAECDEPNSASAARLQRTR